MKLRNGVSPAAIELIKRFEGLRRTAAPLDDGRWTVGYAHTRSAREGAEVNEADAEALLGYDLVEVQAAVNDWTFTPLTQNQFDALVSFVFNIGLEAFKHSSVLRRVNEGAMLQAACAMEMWRKADFEGERIVVDALVRRRAAEKALFLTPEEGFVAAPSAVVQPKLDYDVGAAVPRVRPTELQADQESGAVSIVSGPMVASEEQAPSPSERAVAAVSARLQAIWPDEEPPVRANLDGVDEPAPFPSDAEPEPLEVAEPAQPTVTVETGEPAGPGLGAATVARVRSIFDSTREDPEDRSTTPLVVLGLIGLALFGGGLVWAFNARPSGGVIGPSGGVIGPAGVGFVLGFVGIVCVASAVYFLLERLSPLRD